jgi:PhoPQ-activated pathogenicity-related protein
MTTLRRLVLLVLVATCAFAQEKQTGLDRYLAQRDSVYGWKLVNTLPGPGYHTFVLELTSQQWRTEKDVDHPVWKHWLTIVRPDQPRNTKALMYIGGGSSKDAPPTAPADRSVRIALEAGSVAAEVSNVPNQPLHFTDTPDKARSEDDIIAYTRVKHFETKDDTWLVRLAMVKSAVRAMDAVQEFLASEAGGRQKVDQFIVAGGSKRGWTTWLVGAADPQPGRVMAIVPIVIDALNSEAITKHHFEAYGFFSSSLNDYVNHGLFPHKIGTPEYRAVLKIEDPYEYRDRARLKMPKYMINASGDQFFLPDGSQFYYADLPEEKHLRYVENAKHNLGGSDAIDSLIAFYQAVVENKPRPRFTWTKEKDGSLVVKTTDRPLEVNVWQASNPEARDFRVDTIGNAYKSTPLKESSPGAYTAKAVKPAKGYTAFFVQMVYPGPEKIPFKFTTEVSVVPDVLLYKWEDAGKKYASTVGGEKKK